MEEGYTNQGGVIARGVALRKVFQGCALMRQREKSEGDGLSTSHLTVQRSSLWFTSINIIGGWSSALLFKKQQACIRCLLWTGAKFGDCNSYINEKQIHVLKEIMVWWKKLKRKNKGF